MTEPAPAARLAALHEVLRALAGEPDTRRIHETLVRGARTLLDAPAAACYGVGARPGEITMEAELGLAASPGPPPAAVRRALAERRTVSEGALHAAAADRAALPAVAVPLLRDGRVLGILAVGVAPGRAIVDEDRQILEILADHAALALSYALAVAASARRVARVEEHATVLRAIAESRRRDQVIERALDVATTLLNADRAAVFLSGPRFDVTAVWARRLSRAYLDAVARSYRSSAGGLLLRTGAPVFIADISTDARTRVVHELARDEGLRSALLVPLGHSGRPVGAMALYHDLPWGYDGEDLALVRGFGDQVTLSLAETELREQNEQRLWQLRLLSALVADAAQPGRPGASIERCARALEVMVRGGVPSAWLYLIGDTGLSLAAHAGASALHPEHIEQAARAALSVRRPLTHMPDGGAPLCAAPLGAEPLGALVLAPPRAPTAEPRAGTLRLSYADDEHWIDLDPFVATAATQLYALSADNADELAARRRPA